MPMGIAASAFFSVDQSHTWKSFASRYSGLSRSTSGDVRLNTWMALVRGLGASAVAAALVIFAFAAQAQQKAPEKAEPAAKTEKKVKPKSACNAIADETACKADATCAWVAALMDKTTGKQKRKAYCKTKPKPPVKKAKDKEPAKK